MATVCVIDGDTAFRQLLYDVLTRKGHRVLAAGSQAQAMALLKSHRPDLILLDAQLRDGPGLETAARIRAFEERVPIALLLDAGDPEITPEHLTTIGHAGVLRKELGVELFLNSVERLLTQLADGRLGGDAPEFRVPGSILIVDDDPAVRRMQQLLFEARGFRVWLASSGEEALRALSSNPQLVILDVSMPGMDGLVTLKKMKASRPDLPVIMVSAYGQEALAREAIRCGAYDYVTKPFNVEYLETIVLTKILLGLGGERGPLGSLAPEPQPS